MAMGVHQTWHRPFSPWHLKQTGPFPFTMLDRLSKFMSPRTSRGSDRHSNGIGKRTSSAEWASDSPFGTVLAEETLTNLDGLVVPTVLAMMWRVLLERGGLELEGLFRISASYTLVMEAKHDLNQACDEEAMCHALSSADGHCLAALIKAFLRELPDDVWAPVRGELTSLLESTAAEAECDDALVGAVPSLLSCLGARAALCPHLSPFAMTAASDQQLVSLADWHRFTACHGRRARGSACRLCGARAATHPRAHLLEWGLERPRPMPPWVPVQSECLAPNRQVRCMAAVHAAEATTRMGRAALGTVFAPSLCRPADEAGPQAMMEWTNHAVRWMAALLLAHERTPLQPPEGASVLVATSLASASPALSGQSAAQSVGGDVAVGARRGRARRGSTITSKDVAQVLETTLVLGKSARKGGDHAGCYWLCSQIYEEMLARYARSPAPLSCSGTGHGHAQHARLIL